MAYNTKLVRTKSFKSEDIIIVVMGLVGSGKSQVIDTLTGQSTRAGSFLESCTKEVSANRVLDHATYGNNLVLVDTPGLDSALEKVDKWMANTYRKGVTLAGIIYVHPITTERMNGAPHLTLQTFVTRFGNKHAENVVFLTTKWDDFTNTEEAERHETELSVNYWNVMISRGATARRFYINEQSGLGSPWMIIDEMIQRYQSVQALGYKTRYIGAGKLKSNDIVIVLIGPAGSGKSQVIDTLTGQNARASSRLNSGTIKVSAHRILGHRQYGNKLVLVDTPSKNRGKTYGQILELISRGWMRRSKRRVNLTGIIFTHRITDPNIGMDWAHRDLRLFGSLCGDKHNGSVVLLTTMWDRARNMGEAVRREADLGRHAPGRYHVRRFDLNGPESLWAIVNEIIHRHHH